MNDIDFIFSFLPSKIIERVKKLDKLLSLWQEVGDEFAAHAQLSNYENEELTLIAKNSAWATRIRFTAPDLIKKLALHPEFRNIRKIHCKVSLTNATEKLTESYSEPKYRVISQETAGLIRETANTIQNTNLKNSLLKLIGDEKP